MCILKKPAMKKLGNARALDTASLLGGLMRDHWVSMTKGTVQITNYKTAAINDTDASSRLMDEDDKARNVMQFEN